ncbi:MAG TPA: hypothetical protein ENH29_07325 [Bacteroidetes bacterium]|nr:hypothetical protein [Bacteroidota bacterium]
MGSDYLNFVEEKKSNAEEFISHYQTEMISNITKIRDCIRILKDRPHETEQIQQIKETGNHISDLAMVYGYEGVEVIGSRIVQAINLKGENPDEEMETLLIKIEDTTKAIEDAMLLIDEQKERELIRELDEKNRSQLPTDAGPITMPNKTAEELMFDIREDEKLISLLSDADGQATEINSSNLHNMEVMEEIDINSILSEEYLEMEFDIPKLSPGNGNDPSSLEDDILEIDFKKSSEDKEEINQGILSKIGSFLGLKHKNRISFQE